MKSPDFSRHVLTCAAFALLAGCGGPQPLTGVPGVMPQTSAIAGHADRGKSWMKPEAKSESLLYASDGTSVVYVFSYPAGKLVGKLTGFSGPIYECADSSGDVFITNYIGTQGVDEYAHGGTEPIAVLPVPEASGCSVDPTTGNLAVGSNSDTLYIFPDAKGTAVEYTDSDIYFITDVAYDGLGHVFLDGELRTGGSFLYELPNGSGGFENINLPTSVENSGNQPIQWDGRYLAIGSIYRQRGPHNPRQTILNRLQIAGSSATVIGTIKLAFQWGGGAQFWIQDDTVVQPSNRHDVSSHLEYFSYPKGGMTKRFKLKGTGLWGVTVSLYPHRRARESASR